MSDDPDFTSFIEVTYTQPKFRDEFLVKTMYADAVFPDNKWHSRFMDMAKMVASWSKDPSTKVGCVLIRDKRVIATGYNGWPSDMNDELYLCKWEENQDYARALKNKYSIHAERNAIEYAIGDVKGSTLYITHPPCTSCTKYIIEKGIACVVILESNDERFLSQWNCSESLDMLADELIPVITIKELE